MEFILYIWLASADSYRKDTQYHPYAGSQVTAITGFMTKTDCERAGDLVARKTSGSKGYVFDYVCVSRRTK